MIYVIGDIHGCYTKFQQLLEKIEQKDSDAKYILLGDIYDRGPEVLEMCEWAEANINTDIREPKFQMLMGNHELAAIEAYDEAIELMECATKCWDLAGNFIDDLYNTLPRFKTFEEYKKAIQLFRTLPYYKDLVVNGQRYIIAHAYLPSSAIYDNSTLVPESSLKYEELNDIVWYRTYCPYDLIPDAILVHGHTPTLSSTYQFTTHTKCPKPAKAHVDGNRINLDCGVVFEGGNLAALCLETKEIIHLY